MFYLIGLGLNEKSINLETIEICKKADKIYLEGYTVDFPYKKQVLEKIIKKKIIDADRELVESEKIAEEAKNKNIVLLVYGSPLTATTHISLILKCKKEKIKYKIINNSSIFDAITETGLQLYKFGKTTSLPEWRGNYCPTSFINIIKENLSINSHTLLLVDIGLNNKQALNQLEQSSKNKIRLDRIIICSCLSTKKQKIYYDKIEKLKNKKILSPYCIIIPSKLHHIEEESLSGLIR